MGSGFLFIVKNYPGIVSEGFRLATDAPRIPEMRHDPDGERKEEERRAHRRAWAEEKRRSGIPDVDPDLVSRARIPPLRIIHLQWHDREYGTWRDTSIMIDLERIRIHHCASWMLGREHGGSGAIGVMLFSSPVLLPSIPYIWAKNRIAEARERRAGMSRHALALMRELAGKLPQAEEALLHEALRNEWRWERKIRLEIRLEEAMELLAHCEVTRTHREADEFGPSLDGYDWFDDEGDHVANGRIEGGDCRIRVLGSEFVGPDARLLFECFGQDDD